MTGPITVAKNRHYSSGSKSSRPTNGSYNSLSDSSGKDKPETIPEDSTTTTTSNVISPEQLNPSILSASRLVGESPAAITPASGGGPERNTLVGRINSAPPVVQHTAAVNALRMSSLPDITETIADNLYIPAAKRADSFDPKILDHTEEEGEGEEEEDIEEIMNKVGEVSIKEKEGVIELEVEDDGVQRRETLPTAEERNAQLDKMSNE